MGETTRFQDHKSESIAKERSERLSTTLYPKVWHKPGNTCGGKREGRGMFGFGDLWIGWGKREGFAVEDVPVGFGALFELGIGPKAGCA